MSPTEVVSLWATLDGINPMPISRSRDRILSWIAECKQLGLITMAEAIILRASDARDRGME